MRIAGLALISSLFLALGGGTALAQDASVRGYDESLGVIGEIQSEEPTPPARRDETPTPPQTPPPVQEAGDLPFTGLDLGIVAGLGIVLLGTGLFLRRTTRRAPTA
jgi:hypothetical protein